MPPADDMPAHPPGRAVSRDKSALLTRLRRAEGQVRGIAAMVDDDRHCVDVLQQISAVQAALDKVALLLVDDHVRDCLAGAADPAQRDARHAELMAALARLSARR